MPLLVPGVPTEILNPRDTWQHKEAYDVKAEQLAEKFIKNFEKFEAYANEEIMSGAPEGKGHAV